LKKRNGNSSEEKRGRFEFGKNWSKYLAGVDAGKIREAERSLAGMLNAHTLEGKSFLDIGCGSGLFSLAARRLGATVRSFDYDPVCVSCTEELKRRFDRNDPSWIIERGDVLDQDYLRSLGKFDIVYSWGVLHHTGAMWRAMENVIENVREGGTLYLSIYNDQGKMSEMWAALKKIYNQSPNVVRVCLVLLVGFVWFTYTALFRLMTLKNPIPLKEWRQQKVKRGMSVWHDLVDWVGGYPFEVAKPEEVFEFFHRRGFELARLRTVGGRGGCNEFVFLRKEQEETDFSVQERKPSPRV